MRPFISDTRFGKLIPRMRASLLGRFFGDQRGQVAAILALSIMPMMGLLGVSLDYGRAQNAKTKLNAAADQAALSSVSQTVNPTIFNPDSAQVKAIFNSTAATLGDVSVKSINISSSTSVTSVFITVSYTATVATTVGKVMGFNVINISGTASAAADVPKYVNFYLLLDNSPSMGIGATDADIQKLQSITSDTCAFACHQHTFDNQGRITGDNTSDYYHLAKNNNVTTRIDVLRSATQQLTSSAVAAQQVTNQFSMAVYTFSDVLTTISALSNNLTSGTSSVQTLASKIDLAYAYNNQRDTQTSFDTAFHYMNSAIPSPGDGSSVSKAQEFLFIVTDGVQDQPVNAASGAGNVADPYKNCGSCTTNGNGSYTDDNGNTVQPNIFSSTVGNVNGTRNIQALDPALCTTLKNRNVRIAVLYTPYSPITANSFYNSYVAPISSSIPTNLQSCASPGFFFQVTPTQGIADAMLAMFRAALSTARLTN